ncbi:MAG: hypothetical protein LBG52_09245 [Candidatus Peribacteria bacterium]|jgi:hypothetical protein|nr:hypothetical protein [Candidatus Peribacteria bacterium]
MKFFFIVKAQNPNSDVRKFLQQACEQRNIEFVETIPETFNYLTTSVQPKDLLYRASATDTCKALECFLLMKGATSYHMSVLRGMSVINDSFYLNHRESLPIIPTIPDISNKQVLATYVENLGGFPIIVKATGGSHGVGVMKVESLPALRSLVDYLLANQAKAILRKFIPHKSQGRLVVVGDAVVASDIATMSITHDFRSNVDDDKTRIREAHTYAPEIQQLAVKAVRSCGVAF